MKPTDVSDAPISIVLVQSASAGADVAAAAGLLTPETITPMEQIVPSFSAATGDVICALDDARQLSAVPELVRALQMTGADVAVGSRFLTRRGRTGRSLGLRLATLGCHVTVPRLRIVSDPLSGAFALRRSLLRDTPGLPQEDTLLIDVIGRARVARVVEVGLAGAADPIPGTGTVYRVPPLVLIRRLLGLIRAHPDNLRAVRFFAVGGSGVLVNLGGFLALTALGVYYLAAAVSGIVVATTWNFFWHELFTWKDRPPGPLRARGVRYLRYWLVTSVGSAVQIVTLYVLTHLGIRPAAGDLAGICAAAFWNFRANNRWTWGAAVAPIERLVWPER